jgi:hypothetical protein
MVGLYLLALTVAVIYTAIMCAADFNPPSRHGSRTIPGTTLTCATGNCHRPAVTIAAGYPACDNCAQYLTSRA